MFNSASESDHRRGFILGLLKRPASRKSGRESSLAESTRMLRPIVIDEGGRARSAQEGGRPEGFTSASSCRLLTFNSNGRGNTMGRSSRPQSDIPFRSQERKSFFGCPPTITNSKSNNKEERSEIIKRYPTNKLLTIEFKRSEESRANNPAAESARREQARSRKQVLAQQVERTFKRKIIGNLILAASLAALCLFSKSGNIQQVSCQAANPTTSPAPISNSSAEAAVIEEPANGAQASKLKPVNFTLVDEIFDSSLDEQELLKKWRFMDAQLQDGMKSILKMLFPQIVAISQDAKVSGDCSGGILKWILSLRNLRSWAIKMLDATGKPTSGIFEGSLTMFGNYRQCLNIRAPDEDEIEITEQFEEYFRGQYCVIHLKPWMPIKQPFYHLNSSIESLLRRNYKYYEKTLYDELAEIAVAFNFVDIRFDLCVPSTCTLADIQRVAELLSKKVEMRAKVMRCDISPRDNLSSLLGSLDRFALAWLAAPATLIALSICSTTLLILLKFSGQRESSTLLLSCFSIQDNFRELLRRPKCCPLACKNSSGCMNLKQISEIQFPVNQKERQTSSEQQLQAADSASSSNSRSSSDLEMNWQTRSEDSQLTSNLLKPLPLYGLRNVFVLWFIVIQLTVELKYQYLRESLPLRDLIVGFWPMQIIVNSSLLFESIILITAFTFSYTCLESSLKELVKYVVDKYLRLVVSIAVLAALTISTPFLMPETPLWKNFQEQQSQACKTNGYLNLFFLQNFIAYDKICLPHTWLYCIELQLICLSVPLMLLMRKAYRKLEDSHNSSGLQQKDKRSDSSQLIWSIIKSNLGILNLALITAGALINFISVYKKELPPSWFNTFPDSAQKNFYFSEYLTKTWTHLSVFMVGLFGGHITRVLRQLRQTRGDCSIFGGSPTITRHQQPSRASSSDTPETGSTASITKADVARTISDNLQPPEATGDGAKRINGSLYLFAAPVCMFAIIFGTFSWSTQRLPSAMVAGLYDASSRLLWSLALVYLMARMTLDSSRTDEHPISANMRGKSLATKLFTHSSLILLGKLSFLAYLLSPFVNSFVLALQEQALFPSIYMIFHLIIGNIVIIYAVAISFSLIMEQAIRRLVSRFALSLF